MLERSWIVVTQLLADPTRVLMGIFKWKDVILIVALLVAVTLRELQAIRDWAFEKKKSTKHISKQNNHNDTRESNPIGGIESDN
jgi:hypothetical protein